MIDTLTVKRLKDYTSPDFYPKSLYIKFSLTPSHTKVIAKTTYQQDGTGEKDLILDGEGIVLESIKINNLELPTNKFTKTDKSLTLHNMQGEFEVEITTSFDPSKNTKLEGLYISDNMFCTQCEAEGFRRITYFQDRPDIMTTYTVEMTANKKEYPILLSNGNRTSYTETDTQHTAIWHDPHKKPCYLFALVAGNLVGIEDSFTTMEGREVALKIYTNWGNEKRLDYAMDSLIRSMKWDEDKWGRAYDLDVFHIVAVNDFNMGAMENKSLNIFNSRCILADSDTATDADFTMIEAIVAHEYFHNWTGNRITCRDWFQLSLKEGLTVFRDQEFSADERSRGVQRIQDVRELRTRQFPEDASGLAHPVRPQEVTEINNFYTATIYNKGAEIIRMKHTLLGHETFYKGADIYFNEFDGKAVTIDEWVWAMEKASEKDLSQFKLWYEQIGTPHINITEHYVDGAYSITVKQTLSSKLNKNTTKPMVIPLSLGLITKDGEEVLPTTVYELNKVEQTFELGNFDSKPLLSFNRGFSAPITFDGIENINNTATLFKYDTDTFNRWQAGQNLFTHCIVSHMNGTPDLQAMNALVKGIKNTIENTDLDDAYTALCITMPLLSDIYTHLKTNVDTDKVYASYQEIKQHIASTLRLEFETIIKQEDLNAPFTPSAKDAGHRSLINTAYEYIVNDNMGKMLQSRYDASTNMTTRIHTLGLLCKLGMGEKTLSTFKEKYRNNATVMNKYFSVQMTQFNCNEETINSILNDDTFSITNPNNARSVYSVLGANPIAFHKVDGSMYNALAQGVITLDSINPQTASRIVQVLGSWKMFETDRAEKMKSALQMILDQEKLSDDVREMALKAIIG